jgi:hypothetical protein
MICYAAADVGYEARCPQCGQSVRLPGELARVAAIKRVRSLDLAGIALEAGGFLCMFFFPPWGLIAGAALIFLGWRKCHSLVCTNCGAKVRDRNAEKCQACRTPFGRE